MHLLLISVDKNVHFSPKCQQKPMTLAESLGINISFDHSPFLRQQTQTDLNNFKVILNR